ncbi:probable cytochrome P450 4ac3 [Chironomus tepperi]|uniref:probable cytochrome P450 4ac3 n=1 Tax=Chironomus tepperi TaxID=113505 RepID=UPI00391F08FF
MILEIILIFIAFIVWLCSDYLFHDPLKNYSKTSIPLLKNSFNLVRMNPVELFQFVRNCANKYQKSYQHSFFGAFFVYNVIRAKDAEKILGSSKLLKKGRAYQYLHSFLKTGLLTSEGTKWHQRRRMLTPAFHFNILKEFCEIFKEESEKLIQQLKPLSGKEIDIIPISTQFTLNTVCESAMGIKLSDLGNDGKIYRNNIYEIGSLLVSRMTKPWLFSDFAYSLFGTKKRLDEILKPIHEFTQSIINKRRIDFLTKRNTIEEESKPEDENENIYLRSKKKRAAMMDTLLQAQSEGLIDDEGIIEETDTFTFEGHDTTSAGMTFTLLLLAHNQDVQEKLFQEIQEVTADRDELTMDDLNKMNYMERVLKESLRVYPPVPYISRTITEDFEHDGALYPKGSYVQILIYDIHRDPEYFPDPERFDPDRFLPENCENRHNYAFVGFSAGMRNCIGQRFAMLELKIMLAHVIKNFKVLPVTKREDLVFKADLVLRTVDPVKMKFLLRT